MVKISEEFKLPLDVIISRCFDELQEELNIDKKDMVIRINYKEGRPDEIIIEDMLCNVLNIINCNK